MPVDVYVSMICSVPTSKVYCLENHWLGTKVSKLVEAGWHGFHFEARDNSFERSSCFVAPFTPDALAQVREVVGVRSVSVNLLVQNYFQARHAFRNAKCDKIFLPRNSKRVEGFGVSFPYDSDSPDMKGYCSVLLRNTHFGVFDEKLSVDGLEYCLARVSRFRALLGDGCDINVIGGIDLDNAADFVAAGASGLILGYPLFTSESPKKYLEDLLSRISDG